MASATQPACLGDLTTARHRLDRRAALRFAVSLEAAGHLVAAVGETFWPPRVLDLSVGGARVLLRRRFEPGRSVILELTSGVRIFSCALVVRIAHLSAQPDGSYILGVEFTRKISYKELMAVLS